MSEPIYDAATDQYVTTLNQTAPDIHVHVNAGYTNTGEVKFNNQWTDGPDPSVWEAPQVVLADLTGNTSSLFNVSNAELTYTPDSMMAASSPMTLLGDTQYGDITAGLFLYMADTSTFTGSRAPIGGVLPNRVPSDVQSVRAAIARASTGAPQLAVVHGQPVSLRVAGKDRLEVTDLAAGSASLSSAASGSSTGGLTHRRIFVKTAGQWVISEDHVITDDVSPARTRRTEVVMRYSHVRWHLNPVQDSIRHAHRPTTAGIALTAQQRSSQQIPDFQRSYSFGPKAGFPNEPASTRRFAPPPSAPNAMMYCGDSCVDSTGGGSGAYPVSGPIPIGNEPGCGQNVVAQVNSSGAVTNVVYQHGLHSDATTWCDMAPYLSSRMVVGNEIRHTLNAGDYYQNQADSLEAKLNVDVLSNPGAYVFIGHSNGGIVSRWAAQDYAIAGNAPSMVSGVVSVASPHAGAPLANISQVQMQAVLTIRDYSDFGCSIAETIVCTSSVRDLASTAVGGLLWYLTDYFKGYGPVLGQMTPNNTFYTSQINARSDAAFPHFAVTQKAWDKWTLYKLAADQRYCSMTSPDCGDHGHQAARDIDRDYHRYIDCSVVGGLLGILWTPSLYASVGCAAAAGMIKSLDMNYKRLSVGNDSGDGIVPLHSQAWPGGSSYEMDDADSHIGEVHSQNRTGHFIAQQLNARFGIPLAN